MRPTHQSSGHACGDPLNSNASPLHVLDHHFSLDATYRCDDHPGREYATGLPTRRQQPPQECYVCSARRGRRFGILGCACRIGREHHLHRFSSFAAFTTNRRWVVPAIPCYPALAVWSLEPQYWRPFLFARRGLSSGASYEFHQPQSRTVFWQRLLNLLSIHS
jgi:hypothetical protein